MKLLFVIDTLQTGGAEKSMLDILGRLHHWERHVAVLYQGYELESQYQEAGITVHRIGLTGKFDFVKGVRLLRRLIAEIQPDLIHSCLLRADLITRISTLKSNIPLIGSFVSDSYSKSRYETQSITRNIKLEITRLLDLATIRRVNHIISITEFIVQNNFRALNIRQIPFTVIPRGRNSKELIEKSTQEPLNTNITLEEDNFCFITTSRLIYSKGYTISIAAFKKIAEQYPFTCYLIAGEGPMSDKLGQLIQELSLTNRVLLLGNRSDVASLLGSANCFIFPTFYEGQGGSLIEAMMLGLPIIMSDIPVLTESAPANHAAITFTPKSVEELAEKMEWVITHPEEAKKLGENAQKRALELFDIDKVVKKYDEVYSSLIKK